MKMTDGRIREKFPCKSHKPRKPKRTPRPRGKEKSEAVEKGSRQLLQEKFPNYFSLTDEERSIFRDTLLAARKNIETLQNVKLSNFGTVHDELLTDATEEAEPKGEERKRLSRRDDKKRSASTNLSTDRKATKKKAHGTGVAPSEGEEAHQSTAATSITSFISEPDSFLHGHWQSLIGFTESVERFFRRGDLSRTEMRGKTVRDGRTEKPERRERRSGRKINVEDRREEPSKNKDLPVFKSPKFDSLSNDEKKIFFRTLEVAYWNIRDKDPCKKDMIDYKDLLNLYKKMEAQKRFSLQLTRSRDLQLNLGMTIQSKDNERIERERALQAAAPKEEDATADLEEKRSSAFNVLYDQEEPMFDSASQLESFLDDMSRAQLSEMADLRGEDIDGSDSSDEGSIEVSESVQTDSKEGIMEDIPAEEAAITRAASDEELTTLDEKESDNEYLKSDEKESDLDADDDEDEDEDEDEDKSSSEEGEKASPRKESSLELSPVETSDVEGGKDDEDQMENEKSENLSEESWSGVHSESSKLNLSPVAKDSFDEHFKRRRARSRLIDSANMEPIQDIIVIKDDFDGDREDLRQSDSRVISIHDEQDIPLEKGLTSSVTISPPKDESLAADEDDAAKELKDSEADKERGEWGAKELGADAGGTANEEAARQYPSVEMFLKKDNKGSGTDFALKDGQHSEDLLDYTRHINSQSELFQDSSNLSNEEIPDDTMYTTESVKRVKPPKTKIRVLQDLLKDRAVFVQNSTDAFVIKHYPSEKFDPTQMDEQKLVSDVDMFDEEPKKVRRKYHWHNILEKIFTCGRKEAEEVDAIVENLKGESVPVEFEDKTRDAASATLDSSTMKVLQAAKRKRIIAQYIK